MGIIYRVLKRSRGCWLGTFNMIYATKDKNNANLNRAMMGRF
jgi:hypothetical protein